MLGSIHLESPTMVPLARDGYYHGQPMVSTAAVVEIDDHILMLHKPPPRDHWCLPGGRLDWGESPEECCCRELREETGLEATPDLLRFSGVTSTIDDGMHLVGLVYRLRFLRTNGLVLLKNREPDSHDGMAWWSWSSLAISKVIHPGVRMWLDRLARGEAR